MTVPPIARPPRVDIPGEIWDGSGQLASYMARLSLEHGPIFTFRPEAGPVAGRDVVYLVGPEANRFVLSSHRHLFSHDLGWTPVVGESLGHGLLNMDPPEHTWHRRLMNPAFTAQFMDGYLPLMRRVIAARTRDWLTRGEVDLVTETREITFDVAAAALASFEPGARVDELRDRFNVILRGGTLPVESEEELADRYWRAQRELGATLRGLLDARREAPDSEPDDVLGMLVRAHDEDGHALSDEQLLAHVNILLVAGHETTTTLGSWLLYLLATHPDYGARLDAELAATLGDGPLTTEALRGLPVLTNAIKEAGRMQSPVMLLPRGVLADFTFGGCSVEAGAPLFLAIAAGHRLPTAFADPERFDPDRFAPPRDEERRTPYALVTFGGGPRICIGVNFAQAELKALAAHVRRTVRLHAIPDRPIPQFAGIVQALPAGLPVRVEPLA